MNFATFRP